jgi:hypothetical protein
MSSLSIYEPEYSVGWVRGECVGVGVVVFRIGVGAINVVDAVRIGVQIVVVRIGVGVGVVVFKIGVGAINVVDVVRIGIQIVVVRIGAGGKPPARQTQSAPVKHARNPNPTYTVFWFIDAQGADDLSSSV